MHFLLHPMYVGYIRKYVHQYFPTHLDGLLVFTTVLQFTCCS